MFKPCQQFMIGTGLGSNQIANDFSKTYYGYGSFKIVWNLKSRHEQRGPNGTFPLLTAITSPLKKLNCMNKS